jgi:hypothetical protein
LQAKASAAEFEEDPLCFGKRSGPCRAERRTVWTNDTVTSPNAAPKLSTESGLVCLFTRKYHTENYPSSGLEV